MCGKQKRWVKGRTGYLRGEGTGQGGGEVRKVPKEGPLTGPRVIEQAILPLLAEKSKEMRLEGEKSGG